MRTFNKKRNEDITELKRLHMLKDKSAFKQRKAEIMAEHKISKATVYREMNKKLPGSYAQPRYTNKPAEISEQEKELVKTMLFNKAPANLIQDSLAKLTGKNYSWDKFNQIRLAVERDMLPAASNSAADAGVSARADVPAGADVTVIPQVSAFGDNLEILLEAIFHFEKMSEDTIIRAKHGENIFRLGHDAVMDIKRIITNSASVDGADVGASMQMKIKHVLTEKMRIFERGADCSIKDIAAIQRIHKSLDLMSNPLAGKELEWIYNLVLRYDENADRDFVEYNAMRAAQELFGKKKDYLFDFAKFRAMASVEIAENS